MAPHTRQREPQVRHRVGLMREWAKRCRDDRWMEWRKEAQWWQAEQVCHQRRHHLTQKDSHVGELKRRDIQPWPPPQLPPCPQLKQQAFFKIKVGNCQSLSVPSFTVSSGLHLLAYFICIVISWVGLISSIIPVLWMKNTVRKVHSASNCHCWAELGLADS